MDWITRMNAALDYIEANLTGDIDYREAGRIANCSAYHFQRVFCYLSNTTLAEYIRRRRLTLAALDLRQTDAKVIDVALKYGYDSPTAFTRAFQNLHGVSPSEARREGAAVTAYPPISFQITVKGVTAMNYRIETRKSFRTVGYKLHCSTENNEQLKTIPAFWARHATEGTVQNLPPLITGEPAGLLGLCAGDWEHGTEMDYYIAVASDKPVPAGMEEYIVPAAQWAIFECEGPMPGAIQELSGRIMGEWLPASGYDYAPGPDIEVYSDGDTSDPHYKSWVWMPVKKKD